MTIDNESNLDFTSTEKSDTINLKKTTYNKILGGLVFAIAVSAFLGGYSVGSFDQNDSNDIETELLLAEIKKLSEQKPPTPTPTQQPTQSPTPQIFNVKFDSDDPVKGDPDAPITIIEFSDFECPFCSRFYQNTLPAIEKNYIDTGKAKLVYMDLPLDNLHKNARLAHIAAECADDQGKFWEYHDMLFGTQAEWRGMTSDIHRTFLRQHAFDMGLDMEKYDLCLESPDILKEIEEDSLEAARNGAPGTPTFFIGTEKDGFEKLVGAKPYASFQKALDSRLT